MTEDFCCRDQNTYNKTNQHLKELFIDHWYELEKTREIALKIRDGIKKINPLIQQNTQLICPCCKDVCCISKHGYYKYEDLVYINALGLKPPDYEFVMNDTDPCQFLSENGCSLERSFRPSGCNWYFCDSLLEHMEKIPSYQEFDILMKDLAELWMNLLEEFSYTVNHLTKNKF